MQLLSIANADASHRGRLLTEARGQLFDGIGIAGVFGLRPAQGPNVGKRNADRLRRELCLECEVIRAHLIDLAREKPAILQGNRDGQIVVPGDGEGRVAYAARIWLFPDYRVGELRRLVTASAGQTGPAEEVTGARFGGRKCAEF